MAAAGEKKGTVTAMQSLFPPEEALRASERVHSVIADQRRELDRLKTFVADNTALTKLVRQLPDDISHDIMVPFGSAAFFPGRLIHTNEFLVLLGDGYYAERTSKQTVEILKRREKSLKSQVDAVEATLLDLETEAKFFDFTAVEAKEGIVEIREEFTEKPQSQQEDIVEIREEYIEEPNIVSGPGAEDSYFINRPNQVDERAEIRARLDELEKEELEAGSTSGSDQEEDTESGIEAGSSLGSGNDEESEAGLGFSASQNRVIDDLEDKRTEIPPLVRELKSKELVHKPRDQVSLTTSANPTAVSSHQQFVGQPSQSSGKTIGETSKAGFSGRKAFTGAVIEHTHGLPSNQPPKINGTDQPAKPVSRFKMMKGNR